MSDSSIDTRPAALTALLEVLAQQETLLERLQMVAATVRLLLASGDSRHLVVAADEHEQLRGALQSLDVARAVHAEHLAEHCGAPADAGVSELAAHLDAADAEELRRVGQRLRAGAAELSRLQQEGQALARSLSARCVEVEQRLLSGAGGGYGHPEVRIDATPVWVDARA